MKEVRKKQAMRGATSFFLGPFLCYSYTQEFEAVYSSEIPQTSFTPHGITSSMLL
jgi:hypothetical protein